jgi:hypothetical protein
MPTDPEPVADAKLDRWCFVCNKSDPGNQHVVSYMGVTVTICKTGTCVHAFKWATIEAVRARSKSIVKKVKDRISFG